MMIGIDIDDTIADWTPAPGESSESVKAPAPMTDSLQTLHHWQAAGVDLFYVTGRSRTRKDETRHWLRRHGYPLPDRVYFQEDYAGQTKAQFLHGLGADCLIDDSLDNCQACSLLGLRGYWRRVDASAKTPPLLDAVHPWHAWRELAAALAPWLRAFVPTDEPE
ncbi:MAG: hypothetical protein WD534_13790 [Phycisphaeraceae bacterium]